MKFKLLTTLMLSMVFIYSIAQQLTITGVVTDAKDGTGMPGVNVTVKGTTTGTVTNLDGKYTIKVENAEAILVVSFIGYVTQEIPVGQQTSINFSLAEDILKVDEVVVIGYGTVKKSDATGSVAVVGSKDFNKGMVTSPQDLIVGKTAGVVITSSGGQAGGSATIRIRGGSSISASNDPLLVVDGVPLDNTSVAGQPNTLSTINPNDIESFSVLKDASATAIFGSRASNGVILITTKKGKQGALKVSYSGNTSVGTVSKYFDVLSGDELRSLAAERALVKGGVDTTALKRLLGKANTDWQKEIFRPALSQDHNISLSGSVGFLPYRVSAGYTNQDGLLKNNNMDRKTLAIALNPTFLHDNLKVNLNLKGMNTKNNFSNDGAIGAALSFDPTQTVYNGNKRFGGYTTWVNASEVNPDGSVNINGAPNVIAPSNPVALVNQTDNVATVNRSIGNLQLDYAILPSLHANLNMGYDYSSTIKGRNYSDSTAAFTNRDGLGGKNEVYNQKLYNQLYDFYINYDREFNDINSKLDVTLGTSYQYFFREKTDTTQTLVSPIKKTALTNYKSENALRSYFIRGNYTFMNRYLLTFTVRNDNSSMFAKDARAGYFPALALGWKISEEELFKNLDFISDLKLRLGYGVTGQQAISVAEDSRTFYAYLPTYKMSTSTAMVQFGDTFINTIRANPYVVKLKWEETSTYNIAIDYGFFKNRINGTIETYSRTTNDMFLDIPLANGSNLSNSAKTNVGDMDIYGFEYSLNAAIISQKDYFWEVSYNMAYAGYKVTKLRQFDDPSYAGIDIGDIAGGVGNKIQIHSVSYPSSSFFVFQQVYDKNGKPLEGVYVNRSGVKSPITGNNLNKYHDKKAAPDFTMGLSSRANIKNIDVSLSGRINLGNYVYNNVASSKAYYSNLYYSSGYFNNLPSSVFRSNFNNAQLWSDYYIEDASFFKLDNISIGYNFKNILNNKFGGRLGFAVQNVFTITQYTGLDPEVDGGIDNVVYPRPRTYMVSLSLNF